MATGVSSRSRRSDYGNNRSSSSSSKGPSQGVPSYPLPVTLGSSTHHQNSPNVNSPQPGPTPGPLPGNSHRKGSSAGNGTNPRLPPPPSQDPRQYAQHFPSLPDGGSSAPSRRDDVSRSPPPRSEGNEYEASADSEERWQQQAHHHVHHRDNASSYPLVTAYHHQQQPGHHSHHRPQSIAESGENNQRHPVPMSSHHHMQQPTASTTNWTPYIYPPHTSDHQGAYHQHHYPSMSNQRHHSMVQPEGRSLPGSAVGHQDALHPHRNAESPVYLPPPHMPNHEATGYYHYTAAIRPNEPPPTYLVMNTPPPNITDTPHPQIMIPPPHHHPRSSEATTAVVHPSLGLRDSAPPTTPGVYGVSGGAFHPGHSQHHHHHHRVYSDQVMFPTDHTLHPFRENPGANNNCTNYHPHDDNNAGSSGQVTPGGSASMQGDNDNEGDHFNNNSNNADSPSFSIKVRAVISGWKAGTIIGRQGQVISQLRNASHCKITISDDPTSPDRVLTIIGHQTNVADVLRRVCFMIGTSASTYHSNRENRRVPAATTTDSDSATSTGKASPTSDTHQTAEMEPASPSDDPSAANSDDICSPVNFTLAVPSPLCGCLIGKGGAQIKNFRQTFGVSFSVSSHPILESLDRPVNISGPPANVANCLEEVCRLFAAAPVTAPRRPRMGEHPHPPEQQQQPIQPRYYQHGQQPEGEERRYSQYQGGGFRFNWRRNLSDAAADVHHHGGSEEEASVVNNNGEHRSQQSAQQQHGRRRTGQRRQEHGGDVSSSASGGGDGEILGNAIEECSFELNTGETEVHLLVPNDIVGCIIGKGGKTISEIRSTSGAVISITESTFPPPMPPNAVSSSYPSSSSGGRRETGATSTSEKRGLRSRDRVICIRGRSKNIRTARYLMGSSILNAQRTGVGSSASSTHQHRQSDNVHS